MTHRDSCRPRPGWCGALWVHLSIASCVALAVAGRLWCRVCFERNPTSYEVSELTAEMLMHHLPRWRHDPGVESVPSVWVTSAVLLLPTASAKPCSVYGVMGVVRGEILAEVAPLGVTPLF